MSNTNEYMDISKNPHVHQNTYSKMPIYFDIPFERKLLPDHKQLQYYNREYTKRTVMHWGKKNYY